MLNLDDLGSSRIPGITPALGNALAEAGAICLESQVHPQDVELTVRGAFEGAYRLTWTPPPAQASLIWQYNRATEWGAEAIAVLLAQRETPYTVIESAVQGNGFDYWLGDESDGAFQRKARLEVSGIRRPDNRVVSDNVIRRRVNDKMQQTSQSDDTGLPAYVIVVEFGRPVAEVHEK